MENLNTPANNVDYAAHGGLTKLEYAAIHILAALCSDNNIQEPNVGFAVKKATDLFAELDKLSSPEKE